MSALSFRSALRNGSSILALSTIAMIGAPAVQATDGIFGGGSTLASLAARDLSAHYFTSSNVLLLYAAIGSGSGQRIFISNDPAQGFLGYSLDPATPPDYLFPFLGFSTYPYPRVDFGTSDAPLPANFATGYTTTTYIWDQFNHTRTAAGSVSYPTASYGQPIQLPLFETPVAIAVNLPEVDQNTGTTVVDGVTWTIKSQFPANPAPYGGRIQLSTAQICAIFSGLVTDWNDSTTTIPTLLSDGTNSTEGFADANTWRAGSTAGTPGTGGGTPYAGSSTPITIVYRPDGSGTSFIFTNYLKTVCPLLDPSNTYGYHSIFATSVLPNNSFTRLINKVTAFGRTLNTTSAEGSGAVAAAIGNSTTNYGYIGYLSAGFVQPNNPATTAPYAANVQNDYLRANAVYHPGQTPTGTTVPADFATPSPLGAEAAWTALSVPTTADFNEWNVYAQAWPATTYLPGTVSPNLVDITGRSKLPLAPYDGAYPLTGTSYIYVYSCYGAGRDSVAAATRVTNLKDYLRWHYNLTSPAGNADDVIIVNGFGPLPRWGWGSDWVGAINSFYLDSASSTAIAAYGASPANGCSSVTGTGAQ
ncbi:substrate-binding domain-containing protein [Methylosinus sp. KRF6]|uniref:substrate-binding domain-containing protein n=1 Tax=Methylosinus sp. KRF6 TaxID=2846853 RepID=UPI001C0B9F77|nr:substrate-binding domain-containing protein [Methylosinus sp. KRF6]MBU3887034.1 substrate-binding domain-containing protein [Methylosinus sp. KRF6]